MNDDVIWKVQIAQTIPHEKRFAKELIKLFIAQEKEVLRNVKKVKLPKEKKFDIKQSVDVILDDILFDSEKWDIEFVKKMLPFYRSMAIVAGESALAGIDVGVEFNVEDKAVKKFIREKTIKFSGFVNGETSKRLNRIIAPIIEEGGSIEIVREKIQLAVKKVYDSSIRGTASRARLIARTEMVGTANGSQLEGFKQSGVVKYKGWLTSRDLRVRDTHIAAGVRYTRLKGIPLDQPFLVGNAKLSAPGNLISGEKSEIMACRCTLIVAKKRKKGK